MKIGKWLVLLLLLVLTLPQTAVLASTENVDTEATGSTAPGVPTDFTLTKNSNSQVTVSWTKGDAANYTVVRRLIGGYPSSVTDGYMSYNGTGTECVDTDLGLKESMYFYRAWSYASEEYSDDYAEGTIGGFSMYLLAFIFLCLGLAISGFVVKNTLLLFAAGFAWVGLGVYSFAEASNMGDTMRIIGGVGLVMAIICFIKTWDTWRTVRGPRLGVKEAYQRRLNRMFPPRGMGSNYRPRRRR